MQIIIFYIYQIEVPRKWQSTTNIKHPHLMPITVSTKFCSSGDSKLAKTPPLLWQSICAFSQVVLCVSFQKQRPWKVSVVHASAENETPFLNNICHFRWILFIKKSLKLKVFIYQFLGTVLQRNCKIKKNHLLIK